MRPPAPLLCALLLASAAPASAHDTWFQPEDSDALGRVTLALGTGKRFPLQETAIGAEYLLRSGCGEAGALEPVGQRDTALLLRTPSAGAGLSCWAQSQPFELTLSPALVQVYLKEIAAPAWVHEAWRSMRERGLPWRERYAKHARIELAGDAARAASPSGMAMDARPLDTARRQVGDTLTIELTRDGEPLAGQAVELRHERAAPGLWQRSDAQGRVTWRLPLAGRWVLRATDLRRAEGDPDRWDSRFVTLAFEVAPQDASSTSPKARSTNQAAASSAIASDPPISTTRW